MKDSIGVLELQLFGLGAVWGLKVSGVGFRIRVSAMGGGGGRMLSKQLRTGSALTGVPAGSQRVEQTYKHINGP